MIEKSFTLLPAEIDAISDEICQEMLRLQMNKKEMLRMRLSVEDALLAWMDALGQGCACSIRYGKRYNNFLLRVACSGAQYDPQQQKDMLDMGGDDALITNMLLRLNLAPNYTYRNKVNTLTFKIPIKQKKVWVGIAAAISGALLSVLVFQYAPAAVSNFVLQYLTLPIQSLLTNAISMVTGPMLFLAVVTGITQTGDINTIRKRGGVMMSSFTAQMLLVAVLSICVGFIGFDYCWVTAESETLGTFVFLDMIVDIVPTTIFAPFIDGNALQLVFLAIVSGVALLLVREKTTVLCGVIDQAYCFVGVMMGWIAALIPVYVYCTLVNTLQQQGDLQIFSLLFLLLAFFALLAVYTLFCFAVVVYYCKVHPKVLFQKLLPGFLVVFAASSSTATFWHTKQLCVEQLGVEEACVNSSLPLGTVLYMPPCVILFTTASLYCASLYETGVSMQFFVFLAFLSVIMTMAMPPIAGSEIMCLTGLFMALGISVDGVPLIVAMTVVLNSFLAAFGMLFLELTLVFHAKKLGELDLDRLRSEVA